MGARATTAGCETQVIITFAQITDAHALLVVSGKRWFRIYAYYTIENIVLRTILSMFTPINKLCVFIHNSHNFNEYLAF